MDTEGSDFFDRLEILIKSQTEDDKSVEQIATELGTPIVSIGVLDAGKTTTKVYGTAQQGTSTEPERHAKSFDKDTLFQACSISKPITALAVLKLCQQGTLDLDAPITQYLSAEQLSWISTPKTFPFVSQITLRHLLSHTAGLSCHGFAGYPSEPLPSLQQILRGESPANNEPITMTLFPGQKFCYSGGGFQVIQLILETTLQKPFHEIMDEVILKPLGMNRSTYTLIPPSETNYAPAHLTGNLKSNPDFHLMVESAAAGLWTTPEDLLKAVHAVQKSLESGNPDLLEAEWAKKMLTEVEDNGMALGWMCKKGTAVFAHAGDNLPGYVCYVAGFADFEPLSAGPKDGKGKVGIPKFCGVAVMTSSALGGPLRRRLIHAVSYLKGWPSLYPKSVLPFMDRKIELDERAREWCGSWGKGKWILGDGENGLSLKCGSFPAVSSVPAAIPPFLYDEGKSVDLIADGLETMIRLAWKDGKRVIEIWQDDDVESLDQDS